MKKDKKEEIEVISHKTEHSLSFMCSFGYKVLAKWEGENRLDDEFLLLNIDTFDRVNILRRDFFKFCELKFGNIKRGRAPVYNPCRLEYPMF